MCTNTRIYNYIVTLKIAEDTGSHCDPEDFEEELAAFNKANNGTMKVAWKKIK